MLFTTCRRYIDNNSLYCMLGPLLSKSLLFFHALTGCDYTSSFSKNGKVRPFKIPEKNTSAQETFSQFSLKQFVLVVKFVCTIYEMSKRSSVNELKLDTFLQKYKLKNLENPISCVKKMDSSFLPPCSAIEGESKTISLHNQHVALFGKCSPAISISRQLWIDL